MGAGLYPGHFLLAILIVVLLALAIRLDAETRETPRDHLLIAGAAFFAFSLVYRTVDVYHHLDHPRWSAVYGALGLLVFVVADARVAEKFKRAAARMRRNNPYSRNRRRGDPQ